VSKILIIDDEGIVRDALTVFLSRAGHEVLTAADGAAGLERFQSAKPDLVLLDRDLPRLTGSQVLKKIKDIDPGARVIVLTGNPDPEGELKYRKLGARHFLSKTIDIESLIKIVERDLRQGAGGRPMPRILIVDDDPDVRRVLKRFLELKGCEVSEAPGGREGLDLLRSEEPHLILLDIEMPGMSGLEFLKRLREAGKPPPVMMITGQNDLEQARECMRLGAYDYMVKPVNFEYLETSVWAKLLLRPVEA